VKMGGDHECEDADQWGNKTEGLEHRCAVFEKLGLSGIELEPAQISQALAHVLPSSMKWMKPMWKHNLPPYFSVSSPYDSTAAKDAKEPRAMSRRYQMAPARETSAIATMIAVWTATL
jgi:hypothetical protein